MVGHKSGKYTYGTQGNNICIVRQGNIYNLRSYEKKNRRIAGVFFERDGKSWGVGRKK
jgi:hypothetical protein